MWRSWSSVVASCGGASTSGIRSTRSTFARPFVRRAPRLPEDSAELLEIRALAVNKLDLDLDEPTDGLHPVEDVDRVDRDVREGMLDAAHPHAGPSGPQRRNGLELAVAKVRHEQ